MEIIVINLAISWRAALIAIVATMFVVVIAIYYQCEIRKDNLVEEQKRE